MNIILIDTDILLDVAFGRQLFFEDSATILDHTESGYLKSFIAWHSVANFYYITEKGSKGKDNIGFIKDLLQFVKIAPTTTDDALYAIRLNFNDFEDALQVAAAKSCKANYIITRNIKHYKKSPTPAITPSDYLKI